LEIENFSYQLLPSRDGSTFGRYYFISLPPLGPGHGWCRPGFRIWFAPKRFPAGQSQWGYPYLPNQELSQEWLWPELRRIISLFYLFTPKSSNEIPPFAKGGIILLFPARSGSPPEADEPRAQASGW